MLLLSLAVFPSTIELSVRAKQLKEIISVISHEDFRSSLFASPIRNVETCCVISKSPSHLQSSR